MANKIKINHVSLSVHVSFTDESTKDAKPVSANESISLNFGDENELNRILLEKPHLAEILPPLIKRIVESYDSSAKAAKKLLSEIA